MQNPPLLQKLFLSPGSSFLVERFESPAFESPWHYHSEFEIVVCDGSFGKKFIGNHISDYHKGDLALIGSNLPHLYRADDECFNDNYPEKPASIVIHFLENCFGDSFFQIEEMAEINKLLLLSKVGIEFFGETKKLIIDKIKLMQKADNIGKFTGLIEVLSLMAKSKEYKLLSEIEMVGAGLKDAERMQLVFDYVLKNFKTEVNLSEIAWLTKFSEAAFCRFFKARTKKTFSEFVNEIRISHACKLLKESELSILEIGFDSGFNNLSNFNRQFKKLKGINPKTYRKI
jgi:AraC-like DNA-binding protein